MATDVESTGRDPNNVVVDSLIGSQLGALYRVVERLGEGGMGVVYIVEHTTLKKRFAAKVLSAQLASNGEARARFEAEAHAASKLEHENVVSVNDYGLTADGRPYLVMELLKGQTLFERLQGGQALSLDDVVGIIIAMCEGLEAAHAEGFVHRDVKPENVFLVQRSGGRHQVKVLDFGIAKLRAGVGPNRITQLGQVLGSPFYMAPEACKGLEIDQRADIYSVGIVLYQLTCGRPPFTDENHLRVLNRHMYDAPPRPTSLNPSLPPAVEAVILRALAKEPRDRYQEIGDLADELAAALPEEALRAHRQRTPVGMSRASTPVPTPHDTSETLIDPTAATGRQSSLQRPVELVAGLPALPSSPSLATPSTTDRIGRRPAWVVPVTVISSLAAGLVVWQIASRSPTTAPTPAPGPTTPAPTTASKTAVPDPDPTPPPIAPTAHRAQIRSTPTGATVTVEGVTMGQTPLDLPLDPGDGTITITVDKKGFAPETRTLRRDRDVELDLELAAPRAATRKPKTPTTPATPTEKPLEIRRTR